MASMLTRHILSIFYLNQIFSLDLRFMKLSSLSSDTGRGRAFLRAALNEQSLEKYFLLFLGDQIRLRESYEEWAFFR